VYQSHLTGGGSWAEWDLTAANVAPSASGIAGALTDTGIDNSGSTLSVFTVGTNGHVVQSYLPKGGSWKEWDLTGAGKAPTASSAGGVITDTGIDNSGSTLSVFSVGTNGDVYQSHLTGGGSWAVWDLTSAYVAPSA
jgi:hypothetical protein